MGRQEGGRGKGDLLVCYKPHHCLPVLRGGKEGRTRWGRRKAMLAVFTRMCFVALVHFGSVTVTGRRTHRFGGQQGGVAGKGRSGHGAL